MGRASTPPALSRRGHASRQGALGYWRTRRADEGGAALVEFAIVVPLLVLLLCGTIDFGLIFDGYMSMESGVSSATRTISLDANQWSGPANSCTGWPTN